jgi:hypothetical protein
VVEVNSSVGSASFQIENALEVVLILDLESVLHQHEVDSTVTFHLH